MAAMSRGRRREFNAWPGYVDVLSTLLMVVIFVLMVFVIAQVFLSRALTGSQDALAELQTQLAALSNTLAMRVEEKEKLSAQLTELSSTLAAVTARRDDLSQQLTVVIGERDALKKERDAYAAELAAAQQGAAELDDKARADLAAKAKEIEEAYKTVEADREKITALLRDIAVLESLRDEMARKLLAHEDALKQADATRLTTEEQLKKAEETRLLTEEELKKAELSLSLSEEERKKTSSDLIEEKKISESARLQMAMLNQQLLELRNQIATLNAALDASEQKAKDQEVQIADLGTRLNAALANKVAELASYRSEFFGRLKEVLGERPDIQVVGDRFVFQSEVLFDVASADIAEAGKAQLAGFAKTLLEISAKIPNDIDWILRVDGHTDARPIATYQFASNWELSSARAIAVVKYLASQGVPPNRLVAAGFAENRPLDTSGSDEAYRRNRRIELKLDQR
ncbi:MAG TPA: peptidoglycan -binding protein [Verrucomicrobiae bacterium]|nr:peptidoglycan -binding protein [Verrucomicrobiae bacterium]